MNADTEKVTGCDVTAAACCVNADTEKVTGCDVTAATFCINATTEQVPGCFDLCPFVIIYFYFGISCYCMPLIIFTLLEAFSFLECESV
jgi:hypothetical protein